MEVIAEDLQKIGEDNIANAARFAKDIKYAEKLNDVLKFWRYLLVNFSL